MRNVVTVAVAALGGALLLWGIQKVGGGASEEQLASRDNGRASSSVVEGAGNQGTGQQGMGPGDAVGVRRGPELVTGGPGAPGSLPAPPGRPLFNPLTTNGANASGGAGVLPRSGFAGANGAPSGAGSSGGRPAGFDESAGFNKTGESGLAGPRFASIATDGPLSPERRVARATYDTGDRGRGVRLLASVYTLSKHRRDLDLTPEVERLLKEELDASRRMEYVAYLKRHGDTREVFRATLSQAISDLARLEDDPDVAWSVWEDLSTAYDLAPSRAERMETLGQLEPFLQTRVFSGRFSPLLKTYSVKPGDSLSRIASQFGTTVDAVRRLNRLKNLVIQPRLRLRLLEGKPKVYVDKSEFRLWLTVNDLVLLELDVGLGRDNATPVGTFAIEIRQKDPSWWRPGEIAVPPGDPRNVLGSRWLGFKDTEEFSGYGIHGTTDASSIGTESSAGCIRLTNEDVELLYDFLPAGTPVIIRP